VAKASIGRQPVFARRPSLQPVSRFTVPADAELRDAERFARWLSGGARLPQGADSVYLGPGAWAKSPLFDLARRYPAGSGLKISKSLGGLHTPYTQPRIGRIAQRYFLGTHADQILTFNDFHLHGIAPRLWDVVELVDGRGAVRVCYVVHHVAGTTPAPAEFGAMMVRIRELCSTGRALNLSGCGWRSPDFQLPDGNGNAIKSALDGEIRYVDIHNFKVLEGRKPAGEAATQPSRSAHSGYTAAAARLLSLAGVSLQGKLVLDLRGAVDPSLFEFLRLGAGWVHAYLEAPDLPAAERALLGAGYTRGSFSSLGTRRRAAVEAPPSHLAAFAPDQTIALASALHGRRGAAPCGRVPARTVLASLDCDPGLDPRGCGRLLTEVFVDPQGQARWLALIEQAPSTDWTLSGKILDRRLI
jgi:hypothetical protein